MTVVVPTHGRPEMLQRLLDSLAQQTLGPDAFEVIVVATAGDPGAQVAHEVAEAGALHLTCTTVPSDPSGGKSPSIKRNHGASLARGPVIAFTDDDCVADPGWLAAGLAAFEEAGVGAVEGRTSIPPAPRTTLMAKLLRLLEAPGGYQTCNIFYRRERFAALGGFDPALPFYMEDTELAWSLLDQGDEIAYAPEAVIEHPVKAGEPWQVLRDAQRVILVPYLFKKHPERFRATGFRALTRSHWIYLVLYVVAVGAALARSPEGLAGVGAALLLVWAAHCVKLFWGCRPELRELLLTPPLLLLAPVVRLVQLVRGNLRHRVWVWT